MPFLDSLICVLAIAQPSINSDFDAQTIREIAIDSTEQIYSLECEGTRHILSESGEIKFEHQSFYRFEGMDRFERWTRPQGPDKSGYLIQTWSSYEGLIVTLREPRISELAYSPRPAGIIGHERWPAPTDSTLTMRNLCGFFADQPISGTILDPASPAISQKINIVEYVRHCEDGSITLTQTHPDHEVYYEITLDEEMRLTRYARGRIFSQDVTAKVKEELGADSPLLIVNRIWNILDFVNKEGIWVPTEGEFVALKRDRESLRELESDYLSQKLSAQELVDRVQSSDLVERTFRQRLFVDPDSIKVNVPFGEEGFAIEFPEGTNVFDKRTGTGFILGEQSDL